MKRAATPIVAMIGAGRIRAGKAEDERGNGEGDGSTDSARGHFVIPPLLCDPFLVVDWPRSLVSLVRAILVIRLVRIYTLDTRAKSTLGEADMPRWLDLGKAQA